MARRLPPLNALRAFEAAGRHLSFTDAAAELHVTPAAISHQIKALEVQLGATLFRRLARGLALTEDGRALLPPLTQALDIMSEATQRFAGREASGAIGVSVLPSFAARWLVPRLGSFQRLYPQIDVHVNASATTIDFRRDGVDCAIRYGRGEWPGIVGELFLTDEVFPVCSPALLEGPHPLRTPADLRHHVLIHDGATKPDEHWSTWRPWLDLLGVEGVDPTRGPRYSDSHMELEAAAAGEGVALGRRSLMADDLARGRLIRPFPQSHPADFSYWLTYLPGTLERPTVRAFRDWLMATAGA